MHLIYLDESGNTGTNLKDTQQPIFVLAALIVPETCWQALEKDLESSIAKALPNVHLDSMEIHCADLRTGNGLFKGVDLAERIKFRDEWLEIAKRHAIKVAYRPIEKKRFEQWIHKKLGTSVALNPHVAAFPFLARIIDDYLEKAAARGMFISDENKEIVQDVEKLIKVLRGAAGSLRLKQIVEKGFFIDSKKSRAIQLCDVCALTLRKKEEAKLTGKELGGFDKSGASIIEGMIHRGNESTLDVLAWLTEINKKK